MGKGDKKTKRGKIIMGSHGVRRPKRKSNMPLAALLVEVKPEKTTAKSKAKPAEPKVGEPKPKTVKKPKGTPKNDTPTVEE